ncbi:dihydrolipoyl dehydrogenase [bacterium]|nr:dihydrolipoyl dehydrogenase [bacterium]
MATFEKSTQVLVLGAGPGGYAAAFMAADLGMEVTIVNREANPGGVCLYRGCIPSKALLHAAKVINEAREAEHYGVTFAPPQIDFDKLRAWKSSVVDKLTGGLGGMTRQRKITYLQGEGKLRDAHSLDVVLSNGDTGVVKFDKAILATGSRPIMPPTFNIGSPRVWDSTGGLDMEELPKRLLVVGGGYIGLELGSVYAALGSEVTVVEATSGLLPGADRDLVRVLQKSVEEKMSRVLLNTKVTAMKDVGGAVEVTLTPNEGEIFSERFERVLVSIGRRPNTENLGLEHTKIELDGRGFIKTDRQGRTTEPSIFAIGDISGDPMLAHRATHQGRLAAEAIHGSKALFEPQAIPAVVFTDPELAWAGLTEQQCKDQNIKHEVARFPWAASGRALTLNQPGGLTKMIVDPEDGRLLGVGIVGSGAGELIAEATLALEMGALAGDVGLTIHPHPTTSETIMEAADLFFGNCTHLYKPKKEAAKG